MKIKKSASGVVATLSQKELSLLKEKAKTNPKLASILKDLKLSQFVGDPQVFDEPGVEDFNDDNFGDGGILNDSLGHDGPMTGEDKLMGDSFMNEIEEVFARHGKTLTPELKNQLQSSESDLMTNDFLGADQTMSTVSGDEGMGMDQAVSPGTPSPGTPSTSADPEMDRFSSSFGKIVKMSGHEEMENNLANTLNNNPDVTKDIREMGVYDGVKGIKPRSNAPEYMDGYREGRQVARDIREQQGE